MSGYYDKAGKPLSIGSWGRLFAKEGYKSVQKTKLPNGLVSTVWLGIDHSFGGSKPLIFESMFFPTGPDSDEEDCERYSTLEEAEAGHVKMVEKWRAKC